MLVQLVLMLVLVLVLLLLLVQMLHVPAINSTRKEGLPPVPPLARRMPHLPAAPLMLPAAGSPVPA